MQDRLGWVVFCRKTGDGPPSLSTFQAMVTHAHDPTGSPQIQQAILDSRDRFLAYVRTRVDDPDLAEDILQDSLLRAIQAAPDLRQQDRLVPRFYGVLRNAPEPFDKAFIEAMIPYHQSAIDAAQAAESRAERDEIRALAQTIVADQQRDIEQMRQWQQVWYGAAPGHRGHWLPSTAVRGDHWRGPLAVSREGSVWTEPRLPRAKVARRLHRGAGQSGLEAAGLDGAGRYGGTGIGARARRGRGGQWPRGRARSSGIGARGRIALRLGRPAGHPAAPRWQGVSLRAA